MKERERKKQRERERERERKREREREQRKNDPNHPNKETAIMDQTDSQNEEYR